MISEAKFYQYAINSKALRGELEGFLLEEETSKNNVDQSGYYKF